MIHSVNTAILSTKRRLRPQEGIDLDNLPKMRGLYRRVLVETTPGGLSGTVIAVCTGEGCKEMGGHRARIRANVWVQPETEGVRSCLKCAKAVVR